MPIHTNQEVGNNKSGRDQEINVMVILMLRTDARNFTATSEMFVLNR
jgi:hypothetical protein